jgi:hypothetical protein
MSKTSCKFKLVCWSCNTIYLVVCMSTWKTMRQHWGWGWRETAMAIVTLLPLHCKTQVEGVCVLTVASLSLQVRECVCTPFCRHHYCGWGGTHVRFVILSCHHCHQCCETQVEGVYILTVASPLLQVRKCVLCTPFLLWLAWVRSEVDSKDEGLEAKRSLLCLYQMTGVWELLRDKGAHTQRTRGTKGLKRWAKSKCILSSSSLGFTGKGRSS